MKTKSLIKSKGILLDIGLTDTKNLWTTEPMPNFIKMGKEKSFAIVHDLEKFPWPLESDSCLIVLAAHIIEHIKPWLTVIFMNELWRIMKKDGQLAISTPYPGSPSWWQDPTHCTGMNELSFAYFDPTFQKLYEIHKPKPWKIEKGNPIYRSDGNIECILRPIK